MALAVALLCGIRWPGVLLAGCLFTYQSSSVAQIDWLGEAYIAAAAVIAIIRFARSGREVRFHALDGVLVALVLWAGVSTVWAPRPDEAFSQAMLLLLSVGGIYGVARFTSRDDPNATMEQFVIGTAALGGIFALLLASAVSGEGLVYRLTLEDTTAVGLAQPLPYATVAAALLFLLGRRWWVQGLAVAAMGAVLYTSILSGTRSVFAAAVIALAACLPVIWRRFPLRTTGRLTFATVGLVVAAPLFFSEQIEPAVERLTMNFAGGGIDLSDVSSQERRVAYSSALDLFYESPVVGHGHGSFPQLTPFTYPHNLFLEAGSELGMIGLTMVVVWLALLGKSVLRTGTIYPGAGLVMLAIFAVAFSQMMVSFSLFMARPLFLLTALAAAFAPMAHGFSSRPRTVPPTRSSGFVPQAALKK